MPLRRPPTLVPLLAACAALAACASLSAGARREARLREALDAYQLPRPLAEAWPEALKALADRGLELVGADRVAAGQPEHGLLGGLLAKGYATRARPDGGRVLETDADGNALRYRLEGRPAPGGCQLVVYAVQGGTSAPTEEETRDLQLELEIIRRLDPTAAARLLEASER